MFAKLLTGAIRFYQRGISPLSPARCRFHPTCSRYAHDAIARHGAARGSWLAVRRILRCHPWGGSGYDPVPETDEVAAAGRLSEASGGSR